MKKLGTALFLLVGLGLMPALNAQNTLIVKTVNSASNSIALDQISRITFNSGNLLVKKKDLTLSTFAVSDIQKMTFGVVSGLSDINSEASVIQLYPNPAVSFVRLLHPFSASAYNITITSLEGKIVLSQVLSGGADELCVESLSRGIYFVNVNGTVLKLIKK